MASSTASVSGLVSGLDTASIVSQLMQVESNPQTLLKSRLSTANGTITTLQTLNAKFAALATKAGELSKPTAWTPVATTSSSTAITATAGATASPGTLSFTVNAAAGLHQLTFNSTAAGSDVVTTGSTQVRLDLLNGDAPLDIETGDGSLDSVVSAINQANAGVNASVVKLTDGTFRLRVVSATTGAGSDFTLTNTDGSDLLGGATVTAGRDASITVGRRHHHLGHQHLRRPRDRDGRHGLGRRGRHHRRRHHEPGHHLGPDHHQGPGRLRERHPRSDRHADRLQRRRRQVRVAGR